MSSLGSQWRVIRHYLSLNNLHAEAEKLVQKVKPVTPEQWDNFIKRLEKVLSARITNAKTLIGDKTVNTSTVEEAVVNKEVENKEVVNKEVINKEVENKEAQDVRQKESPLGSAELTVKGLWQGLKLKTDTQLGKVTQPLWKPDKKVITKTSIHARTAYVVSAVASAQSAAAALRRAERLVAHLHEFPEARDFAIKEGAVRGVLRAQRRHADASLRGAAAEALALLGHARAPRGAGANVLALDGGGVRGLVALEVLRQLERLTGRRAAELFDYVVGVSTGAIVAAVLAGGAGSLDEARRLYFSLSRDMFGGTTRLGGASRLVWTHSYYDTRAWEDMLRRNLKDCTLASCNRSDAPKLAVVSCVVNAGSRLSPYLFRSYELGYRVRSVFAGTSSARLWQAVRASAAAPTYFDEYRLGGLLHQDGGILVNNPTGIGLHEAKLLFGAAEVARGTVVSVGTGRVPAPPVRATHRADPPATTWKDKFNKILDSATDTEGVHLVLSDLLPPDHYYRFNPPLMQECAMDEIDERKLESVLVDTQAYIRRNQHKFEQAAAMLTRPRSLAQRVGDYVSEQAHLLGARAH